MIPYLKNSISRTLFGNTDTKSKGAKPLILANQLDCFKKNTHFVNTTLLLTTLASGIFKIIGLISSNCVLTSASLFLATYCITKINIISLSSRIAFNLLKDLEISFEKGICSAIVMQHSVDTELWRLKLVEGAHENIIISGNLCGGKVFVRLLNQIEKQLSKKLKLKVIILSSPVLLKKISLRKMQEMSKNYCGRFSFINTPLTLFTSPKVTISTNHVKCTVIDYGKYFILGGSGIYDFLVGTGLNSLTREQFYKQKGYKDQHIEGDRNFLIDWSFSDNYRDQDWVFYSNDEKKCIGQRIYKQMVLLAYRWECYNSLINENFLNESHFVSEKELTVFTKKATLIKKEDSVALQLLKTSIKICCTLVTEFESNIDKINNIGLYFISIGPENCLNDFYKKVLDAINKAETNIFINHIYFHPTSEIMSALIKAVERGVKITMITSGLHKNSPHSHKLFAPRTKYNYSYLMKSLSPENKKNVKIYEFSGDNLTNHKKLIIIDNKTIIAGNSNLGYKSLVASSDHEFNFIAESDVLAKKTLEICEIDKQHSICVNEKENEWKITYFEYLATFLHRIFAFICG